jgi:hypothetical protein
MVGTRNTTPSKKGATRKHNKIDQDDGDGLQTPSNALKAATSTAATANTDANNNNNAALLPTATTASGDANHNNNTGLLPGAVTASDGVDNINNTTLPPVDLVENENADTANDSATQGGAITKSAEKSETPIAERNILLDKTDKDETMQMETSVANNTAIVRISSKNCIHFSNNEY